MLGDFINTLFVVKNICERDGVKANVYLSDNIGAYGGDAWRFPIQKVLDDLKPIISFQEYVNEFSLLPDGFNEPYVNLNTWRGYVEATKINGVHRNWQRFLSELYGFGSMEPKWLNIDGIDEMCLNKVVIHRSVHRHNKDFDWKNILDFIPEDVIFCALNEQEWEQFEFKTDNLIVKVCSLEEMAIAINSCKYFMGNQSSPLCIASALDVPRLAELHDAAAGFYMGEENYSRNISWHLNDNIKFNVGLLYNV